MKIDIKINDKDDLSPAMEAIAGVLVDNIEEAFQSEQTPGG